MGSIRLTVILAHLRTGDPITARERLQHREVQMSPDRLVDGDQPLTNNLGYGALHAVPVVADIGQFIRAKHNSVRTQILLIRRSNTPLPFRPLLPKEHQDLLRVTRQAQSTQPPDVRQLLITTRDLQ